MNTQRTLMLSDTATETDHAVCLVSNLKVCIPFVALDHGDLYIFNGDMRTSFSRLYNYIVQ